MTEWKTLFSSILCLLAAGCSSSNWEQTESGVIIKLKGEKGYESRLVKLEPVTDRIIHVIASTEDGFTEAGSLILDNNRVSSTPAFKVGQSGDSLTLSTGELHCKLSLKTGSVVFFDNEGRRILREKERSFAPYNVEGTNGFSMRQIFESPEGEAFYGLGQHQSDEFNYKGLNESLYQYNTKVSVPFVISDRNYGILWDNYSLTKFGDPRDYSQLDLFRLYDDNDVEGGLTASYYTESDTTKLFTRRSESAVDYENLETVKNFPEKFPFYRSTITWTGLIEPRESGLYHFKLYYAGYTRLFIDGEEVVKERWRTAWNPNTYKVQKEMEQGRKYSIKLEWQPDGGISYIGLKALSPRPPDEQGDLSLSSEMGDQVDYYFIKGENPDQVISGYRYLTGKAGIMPKWSLGFWQSRERYKSQQELLDVLKEYRRRQIPIDNIVLDWSYWPVDAWGSHEFNPEFFPDPAGMVDEVHRNNARIMISVWPKFYYTTEHYREFDSRGWMFRRAVQDSIRDWIGSGYIGSFYDAYHPDARKLFWNQMKEHLYVKGFDAWWMDASEPDILSNASVEYRKQLMTPTALGPSAKYFNAYALVNAMAIYDGQRSEDPDKRVFLLTRSGFPGLQRYSTATWSGDIGTRWEDMKAQIPAGLNFALSGIPYWTFDIGGFCVEGRYTRAAEGSEDMEEWRELNARWFQFGAFCPLFRSHGQYPFREIFNISPEKHPAYKSMVYYDKLRYRLMPYIYSLAGMTYFDDYTIMRAMVMDFGYDQNVSDLGDQYMFGPSILVAPVYEYKARTRTVYLPESSGWFDFYTGKYYKGGQSFVSQAPYERMPLFIREGSIIPAGPEIQYTSQKTSEPLTVFVYSGRDCSFTLYEDEGINYNYEKGMFSRIKFSYDNITGELTIGKREGEYPGMESSRKFNIVWISQDDPKPFDTVNRMEMLVDYSGEEVRVESSLRKITVP
jgi:alpha-D-xyloside xylohydrolase